MAEIFHARFDSGTDSFSAGTRVTTQGSAVLGDVDGALQIGASVSATRDFTEITSGISRVDIWARLTDTSTAANTSTLFYLLPNGSAVSSGNSLATVSLNRPGGVSTTTVCELTYRNSGGTFSTWTGTLVIPRTGWHKFGFVVDHSAKTVDYYIGDVLWMKGLAWPNASATGLGRIALLGSASSPDTWFDNIRVESSWTEGESVLVDHDFVGGSGEIEASTPTTSSRDAHAQTWEIAPDTANYGAFTLGANGATPDASKRCFALQRCGQNGIVEVEFQTPSSGTAYIGLIFRMWDYLTSTGGGAGIFRVNGNTSNAALFLPDRTGAIQTVQSVSQSLSANTTYTLKIEMRGRVLIGSIKAAALTSGSYTVLFTHTVSSSATGGRGMLIEELCGPFVDTTIGTSDVRRFRYTGKAETAEAVRSIGDFKWGLSSGSIKEAYGLDSAATTKNLFWSRGIQYGHRSSGDMVGQQQSAVIYDETNVYATRQTGANLTEYQHLGFADCYTTLLHRGPWISDGITPTDVSENFAPDFDLKPSAWSASFLTAIASGGTTSESDSPYHDWVTHESNQTLPAGNQSLTAYSSGQNYHASQVLIADGTVPTSAWNINSKFEGNGDPISRAISVEGSNLTAFTAVRVARAFLFRGASSLDGTTLTQWRDNLASPGTLSFVSGSAKTNADGDTGATGFNRRHGWHEITCASGAAEWTLPVASGKRHMPVFRLHSWTNTNTALSIDGVAATQGTDYVIDEVESGVAVLQVLADYTADVDFVLSAAGSSHAATGALEAQAATVSGAAVSPHLSTGALSADAATVAGTAAHLTLHGSTGALSADAATVAGSASRATVGSFDGVGVLTAQAAAIAGTAARFALHTATGSLVADAATVAGTAAHLTLHTSTGALEAQAAAVEGVAYIGDAPPEPEPETRRRRGHVSQFVQARKKLALQHLLEYLTEEEPAETTQRVIAEVKAGRPIPQVQTPRIRTDMSAAELADKLIPSRVFQLQNLMPAIEPQKVIQRAIRIAQERDDEDILMLL